jgi:hypothetical protein
MKALRIELPEAIGIRSDARSFVTSIVCKTRLNVEKCWLEWLRVLVRRWPGVFFL